MLLIIKSRDYTNSIPKRAVRAACVAKRIQSKSIPTMSTVPNEAAPHKTAIDLAKTVASAITRFETLDNLMVFIGGRSDLVLELASQLGGMGYSVSYASNQNADLDSRLDLAELHACCDLYVATDGDAPHCEAEFVILDDQPGQHRITVDEFLLVMSTVAVCRGAWA